MELSWKVKQIQIPCDPTIPLLCPYLKVGTKQRLHTGYSTIHKAVETARLSEVGKPDVVGAPMEY